eukprot:jgi/Chlat1/4581/Chrsp290S04329
MDFNLKPARCAGRPFNWELHGARDVAKEAGAGTMWYRFKFAQRTVAHCCITSFPHKYTQCARGMLMHHYDHNHPKTACHQHVTLSHTSPPGYSLPNSLPTEWAFMCFWCSRCWACTPSTINFGASRQQFLA